jgi:ribose transport system substrate-binding protein
VRGAIAQGSVRDSAAITIMEESRMTRTIQSRSSGARPARRRWALTAMTASITATLVLAGCGGTSSSTSSSGSGSSSSGGGFAAAKAAAEKRVAGYTDPVKSVDLHLRPLPAGGADLKGKTVLVIPLATSIFSAMLSPIQEALGYTGAKVQVCDGQLNPSDIANCFKVAHTIGAAAVITIAVSPDQFGNAYADLQKSGIPVYAGWQDPLQLGDSTLRRFLSSVPLTTKTLDLLSDYVIATSDKAPSILVIGNTDSGPIAKLSEAWYEHLKATCTGCTITYKTSTSAQAAQLKDLVASQLISAPDTNVVLAYNLDTFGPAIVDGLANSTTKVRLGGQAGGTVALQLLKEHRADGVVGASFYFAGYAIADGLLRLLNHMDAPNVDFPARIFTQNNIDSIDLYPEKIATFDWYGTPTFVNQYKASWGVK